MKCPKCGGSGFDVVHGFDCVSCDGKGEIEMTNEEWFCGLSTEEKATIIAIIAFNAGYDPFEVVRKRVREWLQEEHRE